MTHRCAGSRRVGGALSPWDSAGGNRTSSAALEYWNAVLRAAPYARIEPVQVGTFGVSTDAEYAQDRYLAAVENVISRIDHGRFYQLNLCIRLHAL